MKLEESGYVEAIPNFKLEHWWYYWVVKAVTNTSYEITARCEAKACPWSIPKTYLYVPTKVACLALCHVAFLPLL